MILPLVINVYTKYNMASIATSIESRGNLSSHSAGVTVLSVTLAVSVSANSLGSTVTVSSGVGCICAFTNDITTIIAITIIRFQAENIVCEVGIDSVTAPAVCVPIASLYDAS